MNKKNKNLETVNFKTALSPDAALLSALAKNTFGETYKELMPQHDLNAYIEDAFSVKKIIAELADVKNHFVLAIYDKKPIGYLHLSNKEKPEFNQPKAICLERLYILNNFQGRKLGNRLMDYCISYSKKKEYDFLWLAVWEKNNNAIRFYQKWKFKKFSETIYMRGNDPQNAILMLLNLRE